MFEFVLQALYADILRYLVFPVLWYYTHSLTILGSILRRRARSFKRHACRSLIARKVQNGAESFVSRVNSVQHLER